MSSKALDTLKNLLERRYGTLTNPQGCYVNGAWLSVEAIAELIDRVQEMEPEREVVPSGSYRNGPGDIVVPGKSDYELCFVGDYEKMVDFAELTKEEFLCSYSYLTEEEYDATQRVVDEYFPRAVRDFEELRVKVKGLPEHVELREACDLLGGHNFTEKEFFDLNYGCLCVTIYDVANAGVYLPSDGFELWNDDGLMFGDGLSYDFMAKIANSLESVLAQAAERSTVSVNGREGATIDSDWRLAISD